MPPGKTYYCLGKNANFSAALGGVGIGISAYSAGVGYFGKDGSGLKWVQSGKITI